jgi:hypothetical protein
MAESKKKSDYRVLKLDKDSDPKAVEAAMRGIVKLDAAVFSAELMGDSETEIEWFNKNPEIYTMIVNNKAEVVGYTQTIPLQEGVYEKFQSGELCDMDLETEHIAAYERNSDGKPKEHDHLFMGMVINEADRDSDAVKVLMNALNVKIKDLEKRGTPMGRVLGEACAGNEHTNDSEAKKADGVRLLSRMGFQFEDTRIRDGERLDVYTGTGKMISNWIEDARLRAATQATKAGGGLGVGGNN